MSDPHVHHGTLTLEQRRSIINKLTITLGSFYVLVGLLANEWVLIPLFSHDGEISQLNRLLISGFELILIGLGILLFNGRHSLESKRACFSCRTAFRTFVFNGLGLAARFKLNSLRLQVNNETKCRVRFNPGDGNHSCTSQSLRDFASRS